MTGQVYTANGGKIALWNQPMEIRAMFKDGRWTPEEIAARFDQIGQEPVAMIAQLDEMARAAAAGDKPNA